MTHALVTMVAPIAVTKLPQALALIEALGNPATDAIAAALARLDGDEGVHFTSLHAIPPDDPMADRGHLLLEISADGAEDVAIDRLVARIGDELAPIFACASDWAGGQLATFLKAHKVRLGQGWFGEAGLAFAGTPGMSVGRIHREAALAEHVAGLVGAQTWDVPALERLEAVLDQVRGDPRYAWAVETPKPLPAQSKPTTFELVVSLGLSFIATYLWPLALPLAIVLIGGAVSAWMDPTWPVGATGSMLVWAVLQHLWTAFMWLVGVALVFTIPVLVALGVLYLDLRQKESSDWTSDAAPRRDVLRKIVQNENQGAQNHMISVTQMKPGFTRMMTIRLAFWLILGLSASSFRPGYLGEIGTIHFARWVTLPGTRQLVFLSNFGGSWESYLEDFITKAHNGLTAVWSNTVGFPYTENLFQKGATDGERFKRYARQSMAPTPFWYCAYRAHSTANIRTHAAIRVGLAGAMTDEEAKTWLALFGSASRPTSKLESNQIQSLVFGGLGFMPHGQLLLADLGQPGAPTRAFLAEIFEHVAFDDGRRLARDAVLTLALGPEALAKAGLPPDAVDTFPPAFLDGMTEPGRARILGDYPDKTWRWKTEGTYDLAILVYGKTDRAVTTLCREVGQRLARHGHGAPMATKLTPVHAQASQRIEPFGFVDGTSQPVIRGTYRGLRSPDPIHLVEPGEFILGYPDNRGNLPPGPVLSALADPDNRLPIRCSSDAGFGGNVVDASRELGRNGSYLVIRQLEQDANGFWAYCRAEARRLKIRLGPPYHITADFIGAKLIGRWKDGSSLVRNPYQPYTRPRGARQIQKPTTRALTNPTAATAIHPPAKASPDAADNDFLFGVEDPEGVRCPFGSHIRRANPRDSLDPGSQDQIDISNRHRILRVGRGYEEKGRTAGLMFMCLNGDLERQFEFVQQTWLGSETFHGLSRERDPITSDRAGCPAGYTIPTRDGPVRLKPMANFVKPLGGGYFFLPGRRLLEFLSA